MEAKRMVLFSFIFLSCLKGTIGLTEELEDCVAVYNFNEGSGEIVKDFSGNGLDIKFPEEKESHPAWIKEEGYNGCLYFDGENDFLEFIDFKFCSRWDGKIGTIEVLVKPSVNKYGGIVDFEYHPVIYYGAGSKTQINVLWAGAISDQNIAEMVNLPLNKWYHYALVWDESEIRSYLDGKLISSKERRNKILGKNLLIGKYLSSEKFHYFRGYVDEIHIWNRMKNEEEIAQDATRFNIEKYEIEQGLKKLNRRIDDINRIAKTLTKTDEIKEIMNEIKNIESKINRIKEKEEIEKVSPEIEELERIVSIHRCYSEGESNKKITGKGYLLYSKALFEICTYYTIPKAEEICEEISIFASPGEYEPVTFLISAIKNLEKVKITISDLESEEAEKISKDNIDVFVVKCWLQAGRTPFIEKKVFVPELLLKDDSVVLTDTTESYPLVRLKGDVQTNIPQFTSKQFWLTVKIPEQTKPGVYKSLVTVNPANAEIQTLTLKVNVFPIKLLKARKFYSIFFHNFVNISFLGDRVKSYYHDWLINPELYEKYLQDIKEHGFDAASILEGVLIEENGKINFDSLKEALNLRVKVGLSGPFITRSLQLTEKTNWIFQDKEMNKELDKHSREVCERLVEEIKSFARNNNYPEMILYGIDEPCNEPRIKRCLELFELTKKAGVKTTTAIIWEKDLDAIAPLCDIPVTNINYFVTGEGKRKKYNFEKLLYYWQCWTEMPERNRLLAGFYLWKTGYDGIMPYCYQHIWYGLPYIDDDKGFRDMLTTYPSKDGPIPTLQWEALREGIDDARYLTTLEDLMERAGEKKDVSIEKEVKRARELIEKIIKEIPDLVTHIYEENFILGLDSRKSQKYRWEIAQQIISLQKLLEK